MIQLCSNAVQTFLDDGSTGFFQPDILQKKLEASCRAVGFSNTWIAEDIALSVEYTLTTLGHNKIFTDTEIDSIVLKVLRESGLGTVADHYILDTSDNERNIPFSPADITEIIEKYLHPEKNRLEALMISVLNAGKRLNLKNVSPSLILELAKHYTADHSLNKLHTVETISDDLYSKPWLVKREKLIENISIPTLDFINRGITDISGISRLFPSIRIEIKFAEFANFLNLTPPVAEFAIISSLSLLSDRVDDLSSSATAALNQIPGTPRDIPVYLKFKDAAEFTTVWLGGNLNDDRRCFEELVSELKALIHPEIHTFY